MTTEILVQQVRDELGVIDDRSEQFVATLKKVLQRADEASKLHPSEEKFVSQNMSMEAYRSLPRPERRHYQSDAEKLNQRWIEKQFKNLNANWMIVLDGAVVKHGSTLGDYPPERDIRQLQQKTGKCPFVFFSKFLLAIEEYPTSWHRTKESTDFYPALAVNILGRNSLFETEADLDTGAVECYGDLELLLDNGVINLDSDDLEHHSSHLSKSFVYFAKEVLIELVDATNTSHQCRTTIICVDNWRDSPFIAINPMRTVLVGRRVLLDLHPHLILDFDARCTEVEFKKVMS